MEPLLILALVGSAVSAICGFWILVNAFRTSAVWGLCTLIFPFVGVIFVLAHWEENKTPFLFSVLAGAATAAVLLLGPPIELPARL